MPSNTETSSLLEVAKITAVEVGAADATLRAYQHSATGEWFLLTSVGPEAYRPRIPTAPEGFDARTEDVGDVVAIFNKWHPSVAAGEIVDAHLRIHAAEFEHQLAAKLA